MTAPISGPDSLELRDVSKRYGTGQGEQVIAADHVTFTVEAGAFVALTGASGSGKSTMLHMIGALERPDSGVIISNGTQVTALRGAAQADYRRTVGFVFQRYNLLPALTALDNVIAPVLPYRTGWDKRDRARELLAAVGLAGRERSLPARMSGGEQQRIAIARALINTPKASHDPQIAARAERLIRLRDGAVIDDIELAGHRAAEDVIRDVGQLG
jgi:putative ABC transport system ATP-binding protein